jgi:phasin family protein
MFSIPEQFSAARNSQIEAQLDLFGNYGAKAVARAEQLLGLNVRTAKAALEQSSATMRQVLAAQDPRDLLSLTTQGQQQFDSLLAYGRALVEIATGQAVAAPAAPVKAKPALVLAAPPVETEPASATAAASESAEADTATATVKPARKASAKVAPFPTVSGKAAATDKDKKK